MKGELILHIHAPWSDEQVAALNRYQQEGLGHPFTGNRHTDGSECVLIATSSGWIKCCGDGTVIQTWAWNFMAKTKHDLAQEAVKAKLQESNLEDGDWVVTNVEDVDPVTAFPKVPIVAAGDGGLWVPVFIYVEAKKDDGHG